MSSVRTLDPKNGQNLENIPHMLRWWADAIERGEEAMPETLLFVLVDDLDSPPGICQFWKPMNTLTLAGAFLSCANMPIQLAEHE